MSKYRRGMMLPLGLLVALSALVFSLAGCGKTETTTPEPAGNPFDAARVGTDSTLEVMTWNIENFPQYTASSASYVVGTLTTVEWVHEVIEGLQADIVAVEEIANGVAFESLVSGLEGWGGTHASSDTYQNLGFIYRTGGELEFISSYEILGQYENTFMRVPFVLEANWKGIPIVVIAVHLKAQESGASDDDKRRNSCNLLAEYIQTNCVGQRVFVVGDMNDEITDVGAENVFQVFLDAPDVWRFADMPIALGPSTGYSYPSYASHIDHILVTQPLFASLDNPGALTTVVPLPNFMPTGPGTYFTRVSDHLPVITRLQP